jgi:tetratricopeptide (TPR) repeat protein
LIHNARATANCELGKYAEAANDWQKAIDLMPYEESYHRFLAIMLFRVNRQDNRILVEMLEAKRLQPRNPYTIRELAVVYIYRSCYNEAIDELLDGIEKCDDFLKKLACDSYRGALKEHPLFYERAKEKGLLPLAKQ